MPWSREGSGMFDSRIMETEFLNRPDGDRALVAASYRFSDSGMIANNGRWRVKLFCKGIHTPALFKNSPIHSRQ